MTTMRVLLLAICCAPALVVAEAVPLHDPTRPYGSEAGATRFGGEETLRLTATRITPTQRSAVINANRVREGDEIDGARVVRIHHAFVEIATPAGPATLRLLPREVKKR